MIQVYKIPLGTDIEGMRLLVGKEGSYLNPIQDIDGNWIVSQEEYNAYEFQYLKTEFPDVVAGFELIEYKPITVDSGIDF